MARQAETVRDGDRRRRPGRARDGLPPGEARALVRDPGRERADRRPVARSAGTRCGCTRPPSTTGSRACRFPQAASVLPDDARDGATTSRRTQRASSFPCARATAVERAREGARTATSSRRATQTFEADNVVVATGVMQKPFVPSFAPELDPRITAAPLERLPQPLAAPGGPRSRGRREPLGSRHRLRGGCRARDHPVGPGHGSDPGIGRDAARARRVPRAVLRRLAHPDDGHATRPQDASAHPARRRAAPALPKEGSARRRSRARTHARTVGVQDGLPVLDDGRVLDVGT